VSNIATTNFKAFQLNSFKIEDIVASEKSIKRPQGTQVLVRIKAASLNYRDILVSKGY